MSMYVMALDKSLSDFVGFLAREIFRQREANQNPKNTPGIKLYILKQSAYIASKIAIYYL